MPAVLLAATAGLESVVAALVLYTLVQQVENNFLVPKIQGDAIELHPAAVIFAIIIGGALAGLLGAILALPMVAAFRDVVRYLFRRLSPESVDALAASVDGLGLERRPGLPGGGDSAARRRAEAVPRDGRAGRVQGPAGRSGGRGRGDRGGVSAARAQIPSGRGA